MVINFFYKKIKKIIIELIYACFVLNKMCIIDYNERYICIVLFRVQSTIVDIMLNEKKKKKIV